MLIIFFLGKVHLNQFSFISDTVIFATMIENEKVIVLTAGTMSSMVSNRIGEG